MDLERFLKTPEMESIPTFIGVGNILPVIDNLRSGSSFFYDEEIREAQLINASIISEKDYKPRSIKIETNLREDFFTMQELESGLNYSSIDTPRSLLRQFMEKTYHGLTALSLVKV